MDLSQITDTKEIKAIAFDQVQAIEQAQANLRLLQQRLNQLQQDELQALEAKEPSETE